MKITVYKIVLWINHFLGNFDFELYNDYNNNYLRK